MGRKIGRWMYSESNDSRGPYRLPIAIVVWFLISPTEIARATPPMESQRPQLVRGTIAGQPVEGLSLVRASDRCILLATDGWLHDFDPRGAGTLLANKEGSFQPLTAVDLRQPLQQEFGREFEVRSTPHFLVVQPRGIRQDWPEIFEQLHRSFTGYFSVRGVRVLEGNFPLVAIVLPDQAAFLRYMESHQLETHADVLGIYDRASNRIVMYNQEGEGGQVGATIRHEAAHQSAFNTGVHSRVVETPHWIIEGIGCMFQARGFAESRRSSGASNRCDPEMLRVFRDCYQGRDDQVASDLRQLIADDQMFQNRESTKSAYALSWATSLYLSERHSQQFAALLNLYGRRPPFASYTSAQRIADFETVVGPIDSLLASQLIRYFDAF